MLVLYEKKFGAMLGEFNLCHFWWQERDIIDVYLKICNYP